MMDKYSEKCEEPQRIKFGSIKSTRGSDAYFRSGGRYGAHDGLKDATPNGALLASRGTSAPLLDR
jgi:hypothetical protein